MFHLTFVCLDTETTGLDAAAEIIEIGLIKMVDGVITGRYSQLIKPQQPIPVHITQLTGIDNDMVADKPCWQEVQEEILQFMGDHLLVAHNVSFDRGMIEHHIGTTLPNQWADTHDFAKVFLPHLTSYKLISIAAALEITSSGFHRAIQDAEVTAKVLYRLLETACNVDPFTLQDIANLYPDDPSGFARLLQEVRTYAISHAEIGKQYPNVQKSPEYGKKPSLTFEQVEQFFAPDGLMDKASPAFQYRPQQVGMLQAIMQAFRQQEHGIIEAGTGTGKSFAYLVPSLLWAYENNCRVIVSTNTIALQEQLFHKDIPFLKQALDFDFPVALSKGRSNYLCRRRFEQYRRQSSTMLWPEKIFLAQLIYWLSMTEQGDKEVLNLNKLEHQYWSNISSQSETCLGNQCSQFRNCYYMNNRRQCENSMLIITNHALLLQNIKLDQQILPAHSHVIIDEAHNLEDEATKQFTDTVDLELLRKTSQQLLRNSSIISRILHRLRDVQEGIDAYSELLNIQRELKEDVDTLEGYLREAIHYIFTVRQLSRNNEWRITGKERESDWWQALSAILVRASEMTASLHRRLSRVRNLIDLFEDFELLAKELVFHQGWFVEQEKLLNTFLYEQRAHDIYWLEYQQSTWGNNLSLSIAPIDVMPMLKEQLFNQNDTIILTSATLAIANNLRYTAELYLLEPDEYVRYITPSPFDYEKQSRLAIPTDIADYSQVSEEHYTTMLIASLEKIISSVTGGVLVLFTSYAVLNKVYFALKQSRHLHHYQILAHGQDGSRTSIIQQLNQNSHTIVLGANSFWEGIDIKGTGLTTLIITKLPFQPPTKPIISAKMEYIQAKGQNSFNAYSLPQAVLKFRQGCGRLIRTAGDWGAIIVLDKRLLTKNYGRQFIASLPKQPVIRKPLEELCEQLSLWMHEKEQS